MRYLKWPMLTLLLAFTLLPSVRAAAQEGFGFGSDSAESGSAPAAPAAKSAVTVSGKITLGGTLFLDDLGGSGSGVLGNPSQARVSVEASGGSVDAALKLKIKDTALNADTWEDFLKDAVDEAYLRLFFGPGMVEGGLLKVSWGKADSRGPLDIVNPFDLTDLSVTDTLERKIARPMLHASLNLGGMSKLEAVFLPSFEGNDIALSGKWAPSQAAYLAVATGPDTNTLSYAQGGLRFTATTGSVDWGLQYFYGYLPTPALNAVAFPVIYAYYNRYQQVGADLATVLAGFNLRAELAGNITEDSQGDDPFTYNPSIAFSLGFDHDILAGVNVNLQYAGNVRLADSGITLPYDVEVASDAFSSTLTAVAYQRLFRDKLEWRFTALWGVEDADCYLIPSLTWTEGDAEVRLAAGIFAGESSGDLGQFSDSSYLKLTLTYTF